MKENAMEIPVGLDHLLMIEKASAGLKSTTYHGMLKDKVTPKLIGTALSALYQAATCHRKCHGGPHILESLCGRAYNLGASAYILCTLGFYDEALNLIRGIGEIANIVSLSIVDKSALKEWLTLSPRARRTRFSPAKVRKLLKKKDCRLLYADSDWYSELCERYTHVGPETKPNLHNANCKAYVGGVVQEDGLAKALDELAAALGFVSLEACCYFKFEDLFDRIAKNAEELGSSEGGDS